MKETNNEENIENNERNEDLKKNNKNLILIIVLVLLLVLVIGCTIFVLHPMNNKKENNSNDKTKNSEENVENTETQENNDNTESNKETQFDINKLYYSLHENENKTSGKGLEQKIYSQSVTNSSELTGEDLSRIIIKNLESKINELKIDDSKFTISSSDGEVVNTEEYDFLIPYNEASELFREYIHSIFGDYLPFNDSLLDSENGMGFTVYGKNYAFHNGINIGKNSYSYAFDKEVNEKENVYVYERVSEYPINHEPGGNPTNQYVYRWVYKLNEDGNYYLLKIERVNE